MRSARAECILSIVIAGLCVTQAGQADVGLVDVEVVEFDHPLGYDWCATQRVWAERAEEMGLWERGDCPLMGECDDPTVRDAHIPNPATPVKRIRVRFVVFREDDGSNPAATEADIIGQSQQLNADCAPYRVQFVYTYDFIDDSTYRYVENNQIRPMKMQYAESPETQCNIYVSEFPDFSGMGMFPWDPLALGPLGGILMDEDCFGSHLSILTHEMGHNLGLWHTHHGVSELWGECMNDNDPCDCPCYERADGTDADTTGDFCSDTPPTPVNYVCAPPGGTDPCSDTPWGETQPENYMSYSGNYCFELFTDQQAGRMHCWIEAALGSWLVCPGDLDGDGSTAQTDLGILLSDWGCNDPMNGCAGDLDGDGDTDQSDLGILLADWGCIS